MKNKKFRRSLAFITAAALVCGSSFTAFADWPSFQKNTANNGYVVRDIGVQDPPLTSIPSTADTTLPIQAIDLETEGEPFVGVDAETVIRGNFAYTIYNGGDVANGRGGTRMRATDLDNGAQIWDRQIYPSSNVEQLATPVIDDTGTTIYAAINEDSSLFSSDSLSGTIEFGAAADITIVTGLEVPSDLEGIQVSTNLSYTPASGDAALDSITGQIVMVNTATQEEIALGNNEYYGGNMIFYNLSGTVVPKGTYDLKLQITNNTAEGNTLTLTTANVTIPTWDLVKITNITTENPSVDQLTSGPVYYDADTYQGYGEPSTPLKIFGNMLYFGINDGDRCYYQYDISSNSSFNSETAKRFVPGDNNDFYWAGTTTINTGSYIVFGSDKEKLYVQSVDDFAGTGYVVNLTTIEGVTTPGAIRSSIVAASSESGESGAVYFTSQGGYLWSIPMSSLIEETAETTIAYVNLADNLNDISSAESVSTPVITDAGRIYVGYTAYEGDTETGGIWIGKTTYNEETGKYEITHVNNIDAKAPVYSSPLVYSDGTTDYVYFTTNNATGGGYCYSVAAGDSASKEIWNVGISEDPADESYTLQGMSIGANGSLIFGNDLEKLYVIPNTLGTSPESEATAEAEEVTAETEEVTEAAAE